MAYSSASTARWSACHCCGLPQLLPPAVKGCHRRCARCHVSLGDGFAEPQTALAFAMTAFFAFLLAQLCPLMTMQMQGRSHDAFIASGVAGLVDYDFNALAMLVLFIAIVAALLRLLALVWVMGSLFLQRRHAALLHVFRFAQSLRRWAMLEVCLVGAFVALSKLRNIAYMNEGVGFFGLALAVIALFALEASFDPHAIWEKLMPSPFTPPEPDDRKRWMNCDVCDLLQPIGEKLCTHSDRHCQRCSARLHRRKPDSLSRTWALVAAGFILYIPANLYPVMTVISLGYGEPSTIISGVRQLMDNNDWLLAIIVFTASIVIPLLKLLGLSVLLISVHLRARGYRIGRTRLYQFIEYIGRWSNVDIFVTALLAGLVTLGNIASVVPGPGIIAFGAVVVITMRATENFDPRLLWDAAEPAHG